MSRRLHVECAGEKFTVLVSKSNTIKDLESKIETQFKRVTGNQTTKVTAVLNHLGYHQDGSFAVESVLKDDEEITAITGEVAAVVAPKKKKKKTTVTPPPPAPEVAPAPVEEAAAPEEAPEQNDVVPDPGSKKRKKKKQKEPDAPKRPKNAFFRYRDAVIGQMRADHSEDTYQQVTKLVADNWNALPQDQKDPYQKVTDTATAEYKKAKAEYQPAKKESESEEDDDDDDGAAAKIVKKAKKVRDANKPKGPMNAFFLFSKSNRDRIKSENPDIKGKDIASKLGEEYRGLSEEAMEPFKAEAVRLKEVYNKDLTLYKASLQAGVPLTGATPKKTPKKTPSKSKSVQNTPAAATPGFGSPVTASKVEPLAWLSSHVAENGGPENFASKQDRNKLVEAINSHCGADSVDTKWVKKKLKKM